MIKDLVKSLYLTVITLILCTLFVSLVWGVRVNLPANSPAMVTLNADEWVCTNTTAVSKKTLVGLVPNQRMITENVEVCIEYKHK
jgi:hypothetical protein